MEMSYRIGRSALLKANWIALGFFFISSLQVKAGQPLYYEVLEARGAKSGEVELNRYDQLSPGQEIVVTSGGYLAVVSNYYHSFEFKENSTHVLPQWDMSSYDRKEFELCDLKRLQESKRRMSPFGTVAHHMPKYEMTFPYPMRMPIHADETICLQWEAEEDPESDTLYITAKNLFGEDLWNGNILCKETKVELDLSFLAPSEDKVKISERVVILELMWRGDWIEGSPAVTFVDNTMVTFPVNPCQISNAVEATAAAVYSEFNYRPRLAGVYFAKAVELSDEAIFKELLESYEQRKAH